MAKSIMIQGTMSNAGKSLIAAGLCRIFAQDGYKVAPFKSQNMALNSYITEDGLEMGRAQVVQAEAAGVEPDVAMNPILLKPTSDRASQVIVNGRVWEDMSAKDYYRNKKVLVPEIEKAYRKLDEEYDIIVIEGAGSPAEINLKENDIVNMFIAEMTDSPVLLAGDIDRGGVFASLLGTVMLFDEKERERVKGIIINKFRGDISILEPGLKTIEEMTGRKVIGVIPYLDIDIDDEDSLSERTICSGAAEGAVDIAVIKTPRLSNFTDFTALAATEGASVRYVDRSEDLGRPDMICLGGTKNTMSDLLWMRQRGIEAAVKKLAAEGVPVFGICGGYQMLGKSLRDPYGVEEGGEIAGMGLLPCITVFEKEKTRTRVKGRFTSPDGIFGELDGTEIEGYEIHMGRTLAEGGVSPVSADDGHNVKKDGTSYGNVLGSYIHGIFDAEGAAAAVVKMLMRNRGLSEDEISERMQGRSLSMKEYRQAQYDILAEGVRSALDMEEIYRIIGMEKRNR